MRRIVSRTIDGMSAYAFVVTSPATCTWPVVISVSTATRLRGSSAIRASSTPSLIWSAILSGWPSVTDSEVKRRRATALLIDGPESPMRWAHGRGTADVHIQDLPVRDLPVRDLHIQDVHIQLHRSHDPIRGTDLAIKLLAAFCHNVPPATLRVSDNG